MKALNTISFLSSVTITLSIVVSISFTSGIVHGREVIKLYEGIPRSKDQLAVLTNSLRNSGLTRKGGYYLVNSSMPRITDIDGQPIDFNIPSIIGADWFPLQEIHIPPGEHRVTITAPQESGPDIQERITQNYEKGHIYRVRCQNVLSDVVPYKTIKKLPADISLSTKSDVAMYSLKMDIVEVDRVGADLEFIRTVKQKLGSGSTDEKRGMSVAAGEPNVTGSRLAPEIHAQQWFNIDKPIRLTDLRGQPVLLEFWATWCGPCVRNIPHMNELHQRYSTKGLQIVGLTKEASSVVKAFMRKHPMKYPIGTGSSSFPDYKIRGIPNAYLINRDGQVIWRGHPTSRILEKEIIKILNHGDDSDTQVVSDGYAKADLQILPKPNSYKDTLLIIPIKTQRLSFRGRPIEEMDFFRRFRIEIAEESSGQVTKTALVPAKDEIEFVCLEGVAPGSYRISSTQLVHDNPERTVAKKSANIPFKLYPKSVTVLKWQVTYTIYGSGMRSDLQRWDRTNDIARDIIMNRISTVENFSKWQLAK
ncbi:TlpA family protein disulfide reductase [Planctomycetota bacterium]